MNNRFLFQIFTPIALVLVMLFDGQFTSFMYRIFDGKIHPISHILIIVLMYVILKNNYLYNVLVSLFVGYIYDSYYTGVIGIATLILPLIALFVYHIRAVVHTNRVTRLFTLIIIISIFEVLSNLIIVIFGFAKFNLVTYIVGTFAPTLLLNIGLWFILQIPLEKIFLPKENN